MHDRRRLAVEALRAQGGLTVNELAKELKLTRTAAANHIATLLAEGLISRMGLHAGSRRPSVIYGLTPQAERVFHEEYEPFVLDLLDEIAKRGPACIDQTMRKIDKRWIARDRPTVRTLRGQERLEAATRILEAHGFMPTVEKVNNRYVLRNRNCPIVRICRAHRETAEMVKRWIASLLGVSVVRRGCICRGDPACEYTLALNGFGSSGRAPASAH